MKEFVCCECGKEDVGCFTLDIATDNKTGEELKFCVWCALSYIANHSDIIVKQIN